MTSEGLLQPDSSSRLFNSADLGLKVDCVAVNWDFNIVAYSCGRTVYASFFSETKNEIQPPLACQVETIPSACQVSSMAWSLHPELTREHNKFQLAVVAPDFFALAEVDVRAECLLERRG